MKCFKRIIHSRVSALTLVIAFVLSVSALAVAGEVENSAKDALTATEEKEVPKSESIVAAKSGQAAKGKPEFKAEHAAPPKEPQAPPAPRYRTYDMLTPDELGQLNKLEVLYFNGVRDEALKLVQGFFDTHTIIQTFTPQARIIRQRRRQELNNITSYLCSLKLEQEFITVYVNRLRDDVVDYAVDGMLKKSHSFRKRI